MPRPRGPALPSQRSLLQAGVAAKKEEPEDEEVPEPVWKGSRPVPAWKAEEPAAPAQTAAHAAVWVVLAQLPALALSFQVEVLRMEPTRARVRLRPLH